MLIHFGITPYIVFDGDYLPSKAATEADRAQRRAESKKKGLDLYRMNKPSQAHLELQKAVEVTPAMARELIEELKKAKVQYVVAPYEADAQLVYLEKQGLIQGIISEDSDMLVFGAKRLLTKLDQYGDCIEIDRSNFAGCTAISLSGWSDDEFRRMAILSGCDYLASIPGMGLKNAYRLVRKYKDIEKILRMLQYDGKFRVDPGYLEAFRRADLTFQYQRVYCPTKKALVTMNEAQENLQAASLDFLGPELDYAVASGVASGDLDPMTKAPIMLPRQGWSSAGHGGCPRPEKSMATPSRDLTPKTNESLHKFFETRRRTPLAELDLNQFTPSPSQRQLLAQAAGSRWSSPVVPEETPPRIDHAVAANPVTRPLADGNGQQSQRMIRSLPSSNVKKRRILDELEDDAALESAIGSRHVRSPFFNTQASPTLLASHVGGQVKASRKKRFEIWTDNSNDKDVATNPETKTQKMNEEPNAATNMTVNGSVSLAKSRSEVLRHTILEAPVSSQEGSSQSSDRSGAAIVDGQVASESESIMQRQICQDSGATSGEQSIREGPPSDTLNTSVGHRQTDKQAQNTTSDRSSTPLQRIGTGALGRAFSYSQVSTLSPGTQLRRSKSGLPAPVSTRPNLPLSHSIGPDASGTGGSEDQFMIPDCDDEADEESDEQRQVSRQSLDLRRFAYQV